MSELFRRMGGMFVEGVRYWIRTLTGRGEKPAPGDAARPVDTAHPAAAQAEGAGKYRVLVDDNFDYMDESRRWERGQYDTVEEAIGACKEMVDAWLQENYKPGMTAEELEQGYKMFGDDPFVPGVDPETFSAWRYASRRAREICGS
jgi:hypothetical protein